jgi:hypothetical protein
MTECLKQVGTIYQRLSEPLIEAQELGSRDNT